MVGRIGMPTAMTNRVTQNPTPNMIIRMEKKGGNKLGRNSVKMCFDCCFVRREM